MRLAPLVLVVALWGCSDDPGNPLRVELDTGVVIGLDQGGVLEFLRIPYAAAPIGDLRFKPPQPPEPWTDERELINPGDPCPQGVAFAGGGVEDCLFINVWVPKTSNKKSDGTLPVMVWLHGGAFIFGSGSDAYYSGAHLAEAQGVIVVNLSYRLGAFGFLAHPAFAMEDPAYPSSGNWGLDDQYAGLAWVQRNIAAFGGDPAKVTLFGESAGGYSTCVHYVAARTAGMFRAAISESGLCTTSVLELSRAEAEAAAISVAEKVGCTGTGAAACLRGKPMMELVAATNPIMQGAPPGGPFYQSGPPLTTLPNVDGFVIERPLRETFESGDFPSRPLILGATRDEGTLFHTSLFATAVTDEATYREALARRFPAESIDEIVARYPVAAFPNANRAIAEVSGDAFFVCPARRTARAVAASGAHTYYYSFQQEPTQAFMPDLGVFHSAEIPFLFATDPRYPLARAGDAGKPTSDALQEYWSRFATTMDPNGDDARAWPEYTRATDQHLVIDNDPTVGSAYKSALCDFWDGV